MSNALFEQRLREALADEAPQVNVTTAPPVVTVLPCEAPRLPWLMTPTRDPETHLIVSVLLQPLEANP